MKCSWSKQGVGRALVGRQKRSISACLLRGTRKRSCEMWEYAFESLFIVMYQENLTWKQDIVADLTPSHLKVPRLKPNIATNQSPSVANSRIPSAGLDRAFVRGRMEGMIWYVRYFTSCKIITRSKRADQVILDRNVPEYCPTKRPHLAQVAYPAQYFTSSKSKCCN